MTEPARPKRKERGALMVAIMAGIAIMMILSAVAAQNWADVVRRDNEAEMIFRAEDIVRALKRYQKDQGKLPVKLKDLETPGQKGQYFIRKLWKDPLVKGGQWQLLYASPGGGLFDPTSVTQNGQVDVPGGATTGLTPGTPGTPSTPGTPGANPPSSLFGTTPQVGQQSPGPNGDMPSGIAPIINHDPDSAGENGLPIAGVKSKCTDRPFRVYRDKTEYHEWLFSIFDQVPQNQVAPGQGANPGAPKPPGSAGNAPFTPKN